MNHESRDGYARYYFNGGQPETRKKAAPGKKAEAGKKATAENSKDTTDKDDEPEPKVSVKRGSC